jgi:hypothetical protein
MEAEKRDGWCVLLCGEGASTESIFLPGADVGGCPHFIRQHFHLFLFDRDARVSLVTTRPIGNRPCSRALYLPPKHWRESGVERLPRNSRRSNAAQKEPSGDSARIHPFARLAARQVVHDKKPRIQKTKVPFARAPYDRNRIVFRNQRRYSIV